MMVEEIIRIKYGETTIPESWIFSGGNEKTQVPIILSFFLIIADNKKILVDTGSDTMEGFKLENFIKPLDALKNNGFSPEDITDVIITHAHHDHIGCVGNYKNAKIYIQSKEYNSGKEYLENCKNVVVFEEEFTVCAGVKIIKIGGHAEGSSVVEIEKDGEIFVVAGDECYNEYNLKNKIPTASSCNRENSLKFVEKYSAEKYNVLLIH